MHDSRSIRNSLLGAALLASLAAAACSREPAPSAPRPLAAVGDTVAGNGRAEELRAMRATWAATRAGRDYRFTTRFTCFCADGGVDAVVSVSGARVASVVRRDDGQALPAERYYTVEELFARAIAMAAENGHVEVTSHTSYPTPASFASVPTTRRAG